MRKKLAAGGLAVLGVVAIGIGGTYASFSDTEQGPNTLVQAGRLDLRLSAEQGASITPIVFENVKPGDERFYFIRLTNDGTVPGKAKWAFDNDQELENGCGALEIAAEDPSCDTGQQDGELGDQLEVTFSLLSGSDCTGTPERVLPRAFPSRANLDLKDLRLVLTPGASKCVRVNVRFLDLPENNQAQSDSSSFGFRFQLVS